MTTTSFDRLYIGGQWVESTGSEMIDIINPATEQVFGRVPSGTRADVDRAVAAARDAFDNTEWPRLAPAERILVLRRLQKAYEARTQEMANLITNEMGCPITLSVGMQAIAPPMLINAYIDAAEQYDFTELRRSATGNGLLVREPVGVVAAVIPWNSPQATAMQKLAPALIAGCTVVLKPAPETAIDALVLVELLEEAGMPPGVVNIVPADREVSEYLVSHPGIDKVTFTGSTAAGRRIAAICGNDIRRVTLELGGKSAAIILDDADLDAAIASLRFGALANNGQVCVNKTRIVVAESIQAEVIERLAAMMDSMVVGDPLDAQTQVGPVVSRQQRDKIEGYIAIGEAEGAKIARGGLRQKSGGVGWFIEPTLFTGVDNSMRIAQEEIFGPVLAVISFKDEVDAIRIANDSVYGLSGAVYTSDLDRGLRVARRLRTGGVGINGAGAGMGMPMGGFKTSGIGREMGIEGIASYLETKSIGLPAALADQLEAGL